MRSLLHLSRWPVQRRLTVTLTVLTSLGLFAVGLTLYAFESRRISEDVSFSLQQEVDEVLVLEENGPPEATQSADALLSFFLSRNEPSEYEALTAFFSDGEVKSKGVDDNELEESASLRRIVESLSTTGGEASRFRLEGSDYRLRVEPIELGGQRAYFVVAHNVTEHRAALREVMLTYVLLSAVTVLLTTVSASFIAGRLLSPVRRLSETAQSISGGDLSARIDVTGHDDLSELGRTFNDMLERVDAAFTTQRQLLDDAAHELRTPLTVLQGHLEVLDPADADDVRTTRVLLLDELDRMARLVNDLLLLAKARRPDFVLHEPTDVEALTRGVHDRVRALPDRDWVLDAVAGGEAALDAQRVTQALVQLADNAYKHTAPGQQIGIGSRRADGRLELWVRDTGPGVAPELRDEIFERFSRGDTGDDGFGLGLSIVSAIAVAHSGEVVLDDTDTGATFRLIIPTGGPT